MSEFTNGPVQMLSEDPNLGYFYYDPNEAIEENLEMDATASEFSIQANDFANDFMSFLSADTTMASISEATVMINSEEDDLLAQEDEDEASAEGAVIVYPSHGGMYIPGKLIANEAEAQAKLESFVASKAGKKYAHWKCERDSFAFSNQYIDTGAEESLEVEGDMVELFSADNQNGPQANETVQVYWHIPNSMASPLWPYGKGEGVKVAVLDSGTDLSNPLLRAAHMGGRSFVPGTSYRDDNGHGTHVAGIIAARPGRHRSGRKLYWSLAPAAKIYTIKVLNRGGSGAWSWIARGIDWARIKGVDIINMSLGSSRRPPVVVHRAIRRAARRQVIIAAAGNNGPGNNTVGWPARYREVIGVGAVDRQRKIASFSSRGPNNPNAYVEDYVECVAPGVDIYSNQLGGGPQRLVKKSGTSMAAPVVSGICALLKQRDRSLSGTSAFRYRLRRSYLDLGIQGPDNWYGLGHAYFNYRS